jgi:DNA gyrase subunit A
VAKFFRLGDQVRILNAITTDERFTPADETNRKGEPTGPYLLVVTAQGQTLRTPLAPFRTASTVRGRQYVRLNEDDKVVLADLLGKQRSIILASAGGHVLHFAIEEINILSGVGKGVIGIKLEEDDFCLGGALIHNQNDALIVETSGGKQIEFHGSREQTSRGGKGFEAVKRTSFVRIVPRPIQLVDWEQFEPKKENGNGHRVNGNGGQASLFD